MTLVWKYSEAPFTSSNLRQSDFSFLLQRRPVSFTRSFFIYKKITLTRWTRCRGTVIDSSARRQCHDVDLQLFIEVADSGRGREAQGQGMAKKRTNASMLVYISVSCVLFSVKINQLYKSAYSEQISYTNQKKNPSNILRRSYKPIFQLTIAYLTSV
jgi:hypothetical protein